MDPLPGQAVRPYDCWLPIWGRREVCPRSPTVPAVMLFSAADGEGRGQDVLRLGFLQACVHLFRKRGRILRTFLRIRPKHAANEISYEPWDCTGGCREPRTRLSRRQG